MWVFRRLSHARAKVKSWGNYFAWEMKISKMLFTPIIGELQERYPALFSSLGGNKMALQKIAEEPDDETCKKPTETF